MVFGFFFSPINALCRVGSGLETLELQSKWGPGRRGQACRWSRSRQLVNAMLGWWGCPTSRASGRFWNGGNSVGPGARLPELWSWLCCLLGEASWLGCLSTPYLFPHGQHGGYSSSVCVQQCVLVTRKVALSSNGMCCLSQ